MMNDTVTIDRAEYERLRRLEEDFSDIAAFDKAMSRLASGEDELLPAEAVNRILEGESPVRVYRKLRDLTQASLAELSGVNRVQIADIEAGRKSGSIDTIKKLADALGVSLDDLA